MVLWRRNGQGIYITARHFLGGFDTFLFALVAFVVVDYITGVAYAFVEKNVSSEIGRKGIAKKVFIFLLVGLANILDITILDGQCVLRVAVISFYMANEGISILENAARLGLPVPEKLKSTLRQLREGKN